MFRFRLATIALTSLALSACAQETEAPVDGSNSSELKSASLELARAQIFDSENKEIGTASIDDTDGQLSLIASFTAQPAGERAMHLHTTGTCDGPDFKSAGGHLNPFAKTHGKLSDNGAHLGDLPNVVFEEGQPLELSVQLDGSAAELVPQLFDEDGTAIMLHAGPDDYISDPAGAAGPRIACGVLTSSE